MKNELISVIVPIYNCEKYLDKCIESIVNQTYKNLEILLINDGSTDNTGNICKNWSKKDKRIKVTNKENGGISDARNKGLELSSGKYISFVDSDDYLELDMIEKLYNNLIENDADMSICDFYEEFNNRTIIKEPKEKYFVNEGNEKYYNLYGEHRGRIVYPWNKIYKKSLFDGLKYKKGKIYEDSFIICDLLKKANKVSYYLEPLYHYIQREGSLIHTFKYNRFDFIEMLEERLLFFEKENLPELLYDTNKRLLNTTINLSCLALINDKNFKNTSIYKENIKKIKNVSKRLLKDKKTNIKLKIKCIICICFPSIVLKYNVRKKYINNKKDILFR